MVRYRKKCYTNLEFRYIIHTFVSKLNLLVKNCFGNLCSDDINRHNPQIILPHPNVYNWKK